jgi:hypothetical protein
VSQFTTNSIAPMLLSNFVMPVISNIAITMISMFLSDIFSSGSDDSNENGLNLILNEMREGFRIINEHLKIIRKEMHERFDNLEYQIDTISNLLKYGIYNLSQDIDKIQTQISRVELVVIKRFDIIDKNLILLENLIGSSMTDIQWFNIRELLTDYSKHTDRYNKIMDYKDLIKTAQVIENTIINPPMLKWINGRYLSDKLHTANTDILYFRNKSFDNTIITCSIVPY